MGHSYQWLLRTFLIAQFLIDAETSSGQRHIIHTNSNVYEFLANGYPRPL